MQAWYLKNKAKKKKKLVPSKFTLCKFGFRQPLQNQKGFCILFFLFKKFGAMPNKKQKKKKIIDIYIHNNNNNNNQRILMARFNVIANSVNDSQVMVMAGVMVATDAQLMVMMHRMV